MLKFSLKYFFLAVVIFMNATLLHAQEPKSILVLGWSHTSEAKILNFNKHARTQNINFKLQLIETLKPKDAAEFFAQYDMVIFDAKREKVLKDKYGPYQKMVKATPKTIFLPMVAKQETPVLQNISLAESKIIGDYFNNGGKENFKSLPLYLANNIFKTAQIADIPAPLIFPDLAIYHPKSKNKIFNSLADYLQFKKIDKLDKKVIGLAISKAAITSGSLAHIDEMINKIEQKGILPIAYYFTDRNKTRHFKEFLTLDGNMIADVLINFRVIHSGKKRKKDFEELGINVLSAIRYKGGEQKDWEQDNQGIASSAIPFSLYVPEFAGVIDPMVAFAENQQTKEYLPISYQIDSLVQKAINIIDLKYKANKDKKIAIFFYNSPAGANNFGASFLNVSESLIKIVNVLKEKGYQTAPMGEKRLIKELQKGLALFYHQGDRQQSLTQALEQQAAKTHKLEDYQNYLTSLQPDIQQKVNDFWGLASASSMYSTTEKGIVMPMIKLGNILILPQPRRSESELVEEKTLTHDKKVPLNHSYLATYHFVRDSFNADAIIHFGTHGTQEWLPGKERGLSVYDQPNLVVADIPVIYPYIVDDVGEAMQTKRRGRAVVISHQTPPFSPAGLHGDDVRLHQLIHDYEMVDSENVRQNIKKEIIELTLEQGFEKDIELTEEQINQDFANFLAKIEVYLHDLAAMNQPLGLHTFGGWPKEEHMILTLIQMLGEDFIVLVENSNHNHSHSIDTHTHHHGDAKAKEFYATNYEDFSKTKAYKLIEDFVINNRDLANLKEKSVKKLLIQAREYHANFLNNTEMQSLLDALDGKYIPTGSGGDPIRTPDSLPTGKNLYGFNPAKVPTKAAYATGTELVEDLIANHYQAKGKYPKKLAFVLWSTETMRNFGVVEGQILRAIGVEPTWNKSGIVTGYRVIPSSELKRPRIDVVVTPSGLYRDSFPDNMLFIAQAIDEIARLKEDNNRLYHNSKMIQDALLAKGIENKEAAKLSTIRVFGPESGSYGTGTADIAMASDAWDDDKVISDLYLSKMSYAYGVDKKFWGIQNQALFESNLKNVDATVLSRSSNLYGLLTSDDPFQYLGSLAMAVRNLSGKTPETYISNLRNPNKAKNETAALFLAKEMQSRYFHPKWVKSMQEEGHQGAMEMLDVLNNLWGWEVMTPENIRDDQWQEFVEVYINDKLNLDMKKYFETHSPATLAQMSERFLEAIRKDYFKTDDETIKKLITTYLEISDKYNIHNNNKKLQEFVEQKAVGFGLDIPTNAPKAIKIPEPQSNKELAKTSQKVQGQKLEKVQSQEKEKDYKHLWLYLLLLLVMLGGVLYQQYQQRKN